MLTSQMQTCQGQSTVIRVSPQSSGSVHSYQDQSAVIRVSPWSSGSVHGRQGQSTVIRVSPQSSVSVHNHQGGGDIVVFVFVIPKDQGGWSCQAVGSGDEALPCIPAGNGSACGERPLCLQREGTRLSATCQHSLRWCHISLLMTPWLV